MSTVDAATIDAATKILNRGTALICEDHTIAPGKHVRGWRSLRLAMDVTEQGRFVFKVIVLRQAYFVEVFEAGGRFDFQQQPILQRFERGAWESELLALDG